MADVDAIREARARAAHGDPGVVEVTPAERLYRHIDRSIARSIDSRFSGLAQDLAKAVVAELREDWDENF
jgi:hypothetical protein